MMSRLRLINRNQKGYTLIEMLVTLMLVALIAGSATLTIPQILYGTERNDNEMVALRQVQSAGSWFTRDAQMAQIVEVPAAPEILVLTWNVWGSTYEHQVTYAITSDRLERQYIVTDEGTEISNQTTLMAQYIDPAQTTCEFDGVVLTLTVTATVGTETYYQRTETKVYEVMPRAS